MNSRITDIYNSHKAMEYRHQAKRVLIVASVPSTRHLAEWQYEILDAYAKKWADKYNDNDYKRIKIIYLEPNDKPTDKKFFELNDLQEGDQIDIIGHHYTGSNDIDSDDMYFNGKKITTYHYSYALIAEIIIRNIKQNVLRSRPDNSDSRQLPLMINLLACSTARPHYSFFTSQIQEPSIAEKMTNYFKLQNYKNILIRGRLYQVLPVPTAKDNFISFVMNFCFDNPVIKKILPSRSGLHVRNLLELSERTLFELLNPLLSCPRLLTGKPYKVDHFISDDDTVEKIVRIKP